MSYQLSRSYKVIHRQEISLIKVFSWIGTALSLTGAFLVSNAVFLTGYMFFAVGAICWIIVSRLSKNNALLLLESVFLLTNFIGIFNFWNY